MRVVESPDGSVKVVELDPTKHYILVVDDDYPAEYIHMLSLEPGAIILKPRNGSIEFVESPAQIDGVMVRTDAS